MFKLYNANPVAKRAGDCTVRAISKVMGKSWDEVYIGLCTYGLKLYDMPSSNAVWGEYLKDNGYTKHIVNCPGCYTVEDFTNEHRQGSYLLALSGHVVASVDGDFYDTWNSGSEIVIYYWRKER